MNAPRAFYTLACVTLGVLVAAPQTPPAAPARPDPNSDTKIARIEGRVLTLDGEAVRGATVHLQRRQSAPITETTDNDGKFAFGDLLPGRYELYAAKDGYLAQAFGQHSARGYGAAFEVEAGQTLKDFVIRLVPQSVISGRVIDQDGDPVAGAQVRAKRGASLTQQSAGLLITATTDDQGAFRIAGLGPGHYYLVASPPTKSPAERPGRADTRTAIVPTYYPSALDQKSAGVVELSPGSSFNGADIRIRTERVYSIRGKLTGSSRAIVLIQNKNEDRLSLMSSPVAQVLEGNIELHGLPPGDYLIYATPGSRMQLSGPGWFTQRGIPGATDLPAETGDAAMLASLEVTITNSDLEGLELALAQGLEVVGTIKVEGDAPTPPKPTVALSAFGMLTVNASRAPVDKNGAFRLTGVFPSRYFVELLAMPDGVFVKSVHFGDDDVTHVPLDLTKGGRGPLEILLSTHVAEVSATVHNRDGSPMPGIVCTLWSKEGPSPTGGVRTLVADQKGELDFRNLPPGDYYLAAWEDIDPGIVQRRDFLAHFTGEGAKVTLPEGGTETLVVTPVPTDKIVDVLSKMR